MLDKHCAFVSFASIQSAMKAVQHLPTKEAYRGLRISYGKDNCALPAKGQPPPVAAGLGMLCPARAYTIHCLAAYRAHLRVSVYMPATGTGTSSSAAQHGGSNMRSVAAMHQHQQHQQLALHPTAQQQHQQQQQMMLAQQQQQQQQQQLMQQQAAQMAYYSQAMMAANPMQMQRAMAAQYNQYWQQAAAAAGAAGMAAGDGTPMGMAGMMIPGGMPMTAMGGMMGGYPAAAYGYTGMAPMATVWIDAAACGAAASSQGLIGRSLAFVGTHGAIGPNHASARAAELATATMKTCKN